MRLIDGICHVLQEFTKDEDPVSDLHHLTEATPAGCKSVVPSPDLHSR